MKKLTIEVEMEDRWINEFCTMLKDMKYLNIGSGRYLTFMVDEDGDSDGDSDGDLTLKLILIL